MHWKSPFLTVIALQSLAMTFLTVLVVSLPDSTPAASASQPWEGLMVTRENKPVVSVKVADHPRMVASATHEASTKTGADDDIFPVLEQSDIHPEQKKILNDVLHLLPAWCSARLQNVYVRYDHPEQRGLAGTTTVILSGNVPDDEFRGLAMHEIMGHFYELGCLNGSDEAGNSAFDDGGDVIAADDPSVAFYSISWANDTTRHAGSSPQDFVSGYAKSDPFEDLAETAAAYVLHHDAFAALATKNPIIAQKLQWMETYMPVAAHNVAMSSFAWNITDRPWDITKLAYTWVGSSAIAMRNALGLNVQANVAR